ncbi:hypothetical protein MVES_003689 [Malassezia vespertilionis]|uniref:Uncharacterized protein n=1 Tax=Malassezia vespertilionis TaxID=2020962 RepID=A0A2N1J7G3_9BASI|nr:hypothetical protein MVES_003689 [Malassezia vespertilionis]
MSNSKGAGASLGGVAVEAAEEARGTDARVQPAKKRARASTSDTRQFAPRIHHGSVHTDRGALRASLLERRALLEKVRGDVQRNVRRLDEDQQRYMALQKALDMHSDALRREIAAEHTSWDDARFRSMSTIPDISELLDQDILCL